MAAQTCVFAQHATLSGSTADSVTFSGRGSTLRVINKDSSNALYFTPGTLQSDGATAVVAVGAADETFYVAPGQSLSIAVNPNRALKISIVGNGNAYGAEVW